MKQDKVTAPKGRQATSVAGRQAIILTAGKGERMQPLSFAKQKHLIRILGRTILEHNLEQLDGLVDEVILVIRSDGKCEEIKDLIVRLKEKIKILKTNKKKFGKLNSNKQVLENQVGHIKEKITNEKPNPTINPRFIIAPINQR